VWFSTKHGQIFACNAWVFYQSCHVQKHREKFHEKKVIDVDEMKLADFSLFRLAFLHVMFYYSDIFCYGDVLLRRRFVPETLCYRRRSVMETFCMEMF
jgi:hypothetical protein